MLVFGHFFPTGAYQVDKLKYIQGARPGKQQKINSTIRIIITVVVLVCSKSARSIVFENVVD